MNYSIENLDGNFRKCDFYSYKKFPKECLDCENQEPCLDMRTYDLEKEDLEKRARNEIGYFEELFLRGEKRLLNHGNG